MAVKAPAHSFAGYADLTAVNVGGTWSNRDSSGPGLADSFHFTEFALFDYHIAHMDRHSDGLLVSDIAIEAGGPIIGCRWIKAVSIDA